MNLEKIKCFVDIVKYNSFTKAAQENYITQAAISQQIASMEAELGFPLFVRSKRGFTVTDSGKSFYESSLRLLALYSRSLSRARCIAHNLSWIYFPGNLAGPGYHPHLPRDPASAPGISQHADHDPPGHSNRIIS